MPVAYSSANSQVHMYTYKDVHIDPVCRKDLPRVQAIGENLEEQWTTYFFTLQASKKWGMAPGTSPYP